MEEEGGIYGRKKLKEEKRKENVIKTTRSVCRNVKRRVANEANGRKEETKAVSRMRTRRKIGRAARAINRNDSLTPRGET